MIKLARYLKKYAWMLVLAVILLFGQAMLDLNLPNMMSKIVNVGIQQSGIEDVAPVAMPKAYLQVVGMFMSDDERQVLEKAYTPYAELSAEEQAKVDKKFPNAAEKEVLVLTSDPDLRAQADEIMGRASFALINLMQQAAEKQGMQIGQAGSSSADFDFEKLSKMLMAAPLPQQAVDASIKVAKDTPETMTRSVAAALNKAIYEQLGADIGRIQMDYILRIGSIMLLLSLCVVSCAVGAGYFFARIGAGVARDLRGDIFSKVSRFSNSEMDKFSTASLITRTTNDITQVQMMYTMGMRMMVYAPILGVGGIIMALRKSPAMSWIIGAAVALLMVIIGILLVVVMPRFKKMQALIDRLNLVARENLTGIMVVRAFSNQAFQEKRFKKANEDLTQNSLFVNRAIALLMPVMMLIMNVVALFIIWYGADQISQSTIQVGDLMAFIQYSMQVIMGFLFIAVVFIMVPRASVSADRINEVLLSETTIHDPKNPKTLGGPAKGEVSFHNVSFKYSGADEDVLCNINFTAKPGQTTAFIGSTGSGKSTLVNLIPRFYDVSEGSITLDGVDVRELTQHELRQNIGYVPQKGLLFTGDISSNLRYGDEQASDTTLRQAAEVAQATEFIDTLDDGFATAISQGGTNVSGGQRQRLAIARALVKKAPVYIFDDSFSALDFATDSKLRAALKPYTANSTVLIVAQRVSTIMKAEQIVVLDDGAVVGIGTHKELLENCPTYREIAESQLSKEELA